MFDVAGELVARGSVAVCDRCCVDCGSRGPFFGPHRLCSRCVRLDETYLVGAAP